MFRANFFLGTILFSIAFCTAQGADIYVPDDYGTIQEAINAAVDDDVVFVRPGTYVENIDFKGKAITVTSEKGPDVTTIDGNQAGSTVTFRSGEGLESVLEGFTVTNGWGTDVKKHRWGGGIYCQYSSPTIRNNVVSANTSESGAGIAADDYSYPIIAGNVISENLCAHWCGGGGIFCTRDSGGRIVGNLILDNEVGSGGGGIALDGRGSPEIVNNMIFGNTADHGGGLYCGEGSPIVNGNTIYGNSANRGGGLSCEKSPHNLCNTIIWGNTAATGDEIHLSNNTSLSISFSDVEGGQSPVYVGSGCTLDWGAGMIDADPLFLDPAKSDFHIPFESACRSAGDRSAPGLPDTDFEGDPRTGLFAFPDIGADEFHTHFYVRGSVTYGSSATGVIIGWPQTNPVLLISGSGVLPTPDPTPFGDFWLAPPWPYRVHFNPMPDNGVRLFERVVSTGLPPGTQIPFQALVGTELSNLCVVEIE